MTKYWVIAPFSATEPEIFEEVWEFDLVNGVISIGWSDLGDISSYDDWDGLKSEYEKQYDATNPSTVTRTVNMLWNFSREIREGDIILARQGTKRLAAVGIVKGTAYFNHNKGAALAAKHPEYGHCSFINIHWQDSPRDKEYDRVVFGIQTLYEIDELEYKALITDDVSDATDVEEASEKTENLPQFFLEKYLEHFIVNNFDEIFKGDIELYRDSEGTIGQQYRTDVGIIDILAIEPATGTFVVIELKKGRSSDKVVGQILRYIGWVSEELCDDEQKVKGLIICREPDDKLYYAASAVSNIEVNYYHIDFELSDKP